MTSIVLAPIRDVNSATSPDKVEELIETNFISDTTEQTYLKYFYIEPHDELAFPKGGVVDFSKCFSIRKQSYGDLLKSKTIQLELPVVSHLSRKLALYFHRVSPST